MLRVGGAGHQRDGRVGHRVDETPESHLRRFGSHRRARVGQPLRAHAPHAPSDQRIWHPAAFDAARGQAEGGVEAHAGRPLIQRNDTGRLARTLDATRSASRA